MNISFDFDGTLIHMNHLVERFQRFGDEIFIVTSRVESKNNHQDIFDEALDLGIKRENIYFTNNELKLDKLKELNINLHFDDDSVEVDEINQNSTTCKALLVNFKHSYHND